IGTPHVFHMDNTLLCLDAGKAVLCEKPFTINADQARRVVARAREKGLFLMEAMWTRFFPAMDRLRDLLAEGTIGELRMLYADFGFRVDINPKGRLFDLALGGGALLDVGIYPVSLASMLLGSPAQISSQAHLGVTGADEQTAVILGYAGGELALLSCATRTLTPQTATLIGTGGTLVIERPWWTPERFTLVLPEMGEQIVQVPFEGNGYQYEAAAVGDCLRAGKLEHDLMPLDETVRLMETLDAIRAPWGLKYPGE
ncbi:MAG: Gfo/Idh/MocA family oxidoreductase, partial [Anaerolineae bacterium]|nr:Gfo/Idh/MocA family oxidoreductase [Anaerolineae bacterium]